MKVNIAKAAKHLGVSQATLRRWETEGKITVDRTPKGHRRYDLSQIQPRPKLIESKHTIGYARMSSHDQKNDLERQASVLNTFCIARGWEHEILQDLGSGLNYNKKGLKKIIKEICSGTVQRIVITHKDRLLRFGSELIFSLCEQFGVEVVIINHAEDRNLEEDLVQDVLEIITVFSARLYGLRSHKNRKLLQTLKEVASEL